MSGQRYRLTELADGDADEILTYTRREFGPLQLRAYSALIDKAAKMVGESPFRIGSKARDELGQNVRSFHIEIAAARLGAASHILYYIPSSFEDGTPGAIILRVLWDGREPRRFVGQGLDELTKELELDRTQPIAESCSAPGREVPNNIWDRARG